MDESRIEPWQKATWRPPHLELIFNEEDQATVKRRLPISGIMIRVDGRAGLLAYELPNGKIARQAVLLDECLPAGVA